jgi:magnesium transporter
VNPDERLAFAFVGAHPAETARLLERAEPSSAAEILMRVPTETAAAVFRALAPAPAAACAASLTDDALAGITEALPLDRASATLRRLAPERREVVLAGLSEERRSRLGTALSFPENTAGALADPLALAVTEDMTVAEAQHQLRGSERHLFYYVYIVTRDHKLAGTLALPELMAAAPADKLSALMHRDLVSLDAHLDLATVVMHPSWRDFDALPVVDGAGKLIGAIRHKTVRLLSWEPDPPMMATIVSLSELYWAGLSGMLASLASAQSRGEEDQDVS